MSLQKPAPSCTFPHSVCAVWLHCKDFAFRLKWNLPVPTVNVLLYCFQTHKMFSELVEQILQLLGKDLPENVKHCTQYFQLLEHYVLLVSYGCSCHQWHWFNAWVGNTGSLLNPCCSQGTKACSHMFGRQAFPRLIMFLLGPSTSSPNQEVGLASLLKELENTCQLLLSLPVFCTACFCV